MRQFSELEPYYDAVILGAGPAGIAAANKMLKQGYTNILIVEARDRVGGRTLTHPIYGDEGGTWDHVNDPSLRRENAPQLHDNEHNFIGDARKRGYTLSYDPQNSHLYYNGERISREKFFHYAELAAKELKEITDRHGDMSVADALSLMKSQDDFMKWVIQMEYGSASSGQDISKVSVSSSLEMFSLASGVLLKQGMGTFIRERAKPIEPYTVLNTRVKGIHTTRTPFSELDVIGPNGEERMIRAKCVLSTIPPSVYNHKGDEFEIEHNFPQWKTDAMHALPSGAMNKVILKLPDGFLKSRGIEDNQHYEIFQRDLGSMFFQAAPAGRDILVGFLGGQTSIDLEKEGVDAATRYTLPFLETVPEFKDIRSHIESTHLTQWYEDTYARGSYSVPLVGACDARKQLFKPIDNKIFFAGEACAHNGWQTQIYGAIETGEHAAQNMINALENSKQVMRITSKPSQTAQVNEKLSNIR